MNRSKAKEIFVKFYCKNRAFCELYPDRCKKEGCEIYHAIKAIEAEPIVRCRDCKYYLESNETCGMIAVRLMFYADGKRWTDNCFCCWGERREDG